MRTWKLDDTADDGSGGEVLPNDAAYAVPCGAGVCALGESCYRCEETEMCGASAPGGGADCLKLCRPAFSPNEGSPLELTTPARVAALAALECEVVPRGISIAGAELGSLEGLESITEVAGKLAVNFSAGLTDLHGLEGLSTVGDLVLDNAPTLTSLAGLEALVEVRGSLVLRTDRLASLAGLDNLEYVGGALILDHNEVLSSVLELEGVEFGTSGELYVAGNPELTSLQGLERIVVRDSVTISGDNGLVTLDGLTGLQEVKGRVRIEDTTRLESLRGLNALKTAEDVYIEENPELVSLDALELLETTQHLTFISNPKLENVTELTSLREVYELLIWSNASVAAVDFPRLQTAEYRVHASGSGFELPDDRPARVEFPVLAAVGQEIHVRDNTALRLVSAPLLVGNAEMDFRIENNLGSMTLEFPALRHGQVRINGNAGLETLAGIASFAPAELLEVNDNPLLPECEVAAMVAPGGYCFCGGNDAEAVCD